MLGAHVSVAGGLHNGISNGEKFGCSAIQIFVKNPNRWQSKSFTQEEIDRFCQAWAASDQVKEVIVHDIHLTNLASPKPDILEKSRQHFQSQIDLVCQLGVRYLVKHLGSHTGAGEPVGLKNLSQSLDFLLEETRHTDVMLLLETTAGQGANLGYIFEHIRQMIDDSKYPERLGVCFDTCHVFAAGYDLRTEDDYQRTFEEFDRVVGLDRLLAFHLNDAKSEFNSRVDRHQHIGQGNIGITPFQLLVNDPRFSAVPMIIETPKMDEMHGENLKVLKELKGNP